SAPAAYLPICRPVVSCCTRTQAEQMSAGLNMIARGSPTKRGPVGVGMLVGVGGATADGDGVTAGDAGLGNVAPSRNACTVSLAMPKFRPTESLRPNSTIAITLPRMLTIGPPELP